MAKKIVSRPKEKWRNQLRCLPLYRLKHMTLAFTEIGRNTMAPNKIGYPTRREYLGGLNQTWPLI